ncbi:MAG TPA: fibronectin type III domain-containing protein [Terriglobia bacterium]|nr:fibronectin type III domain-containing protein [Terriglobia bacterium]
MSQTKSKPIKAIGGYNKKSPTENLAHANAIHSGLFTDPVDYPAPPIDEATFKGAIETLSAKITAALDGGKKALAERNRQEQVVIKMMRQLGQYAEVACKDDMPIFLKSGFQAVSIVKAGQQPLSQSIRKITAGKISGQLHMLLMAVDGATAYEVRWAAIVNGTPGTWATQLVTKTRPAVTLKGLTPGATYSIQVRSFADESGFSDWSDPVTRICM